MKTIRNLDHLGFILQQEKKDRLLESVLITFFIVLTLGSLTALYWNS